MAYALDSETEQKLREQAKADGVTHLSTGVAVRQGGKILIVRRASHDYLGGQYELPGGGVDEGETLEAAARRELLEETGLRVADVSTVFDGFDYSTDKKPKVRQFNFLVSVEDGAVTLDENEHDDFQWVDRDSLEQVTMSDNMKHCVREALGLS